MTFQAKTYWLVGASEGLGRALAHQLAKEGAELVLSSRNAERLESLVAELPNARAVSMDVTDLTSVRQAAEAVKPVDAVIYNAGAYEPMRTSEWDTEQAVNMSDVNYLGALRVQTTDLGERDIARVAIGALATVSIEALGLDVGGRVVEIDLQATTVGGDVVFPVVVELDERLEGLRWGMSVDVEIETE